MTEEYEEQTREQLTNKFADAIRLLQAFGDSLNELMDEEILQDVEDLLVEDNDKDDRKTTLKKSIVKMVMHCPDPLCKVCGEAYCVFNCPDHFGETWQHECPECGDYQPMAKKDFIYWFDEDGNERPIEERQRMLKEQEEQEAGQ